MSNEPIDIDDAIKTMTHEALECRDFQHNWRPWQASKYTWGFIRVLRCSNCATERHEELNRFGGRVKSPKYVYPEGYTIKGLGRVTGDRKDAIRLVALLRETNRQKVKDRDVMAS